MATAARAGLLADDADAGLGLSLHVSLRQRLEACRTPPACCLGAVLLWDVLFRGQLGFTFTFLEEVWSRNLPNLMMSPLKPTELAASLMLMSLVRLLIGTIPVTFLTLLLFAFNIYALGLPLIAFFINLVLTGWAVGLVISGLVMRHGLGAESLAYSVMILLLPLCCVYYPIWVLPVWLQPVAWSLAPTYVFEGMRAVLLDGVFRADLMLECFALNIAYLVVWLRDVSATCCAARATTARCSPWASDRRVR